jgi:MFS family permease
VTANRWIILGALCVVRLGIGFQFQTVGSVAPFLVDDLGIGYSQVGTLVGLFMLPGIVLALPAGFLGKLYGDKRVTLFATAGMIVGGLVCGVASTYGVLLAGRLLSGAGTAVLFVLLAKMVTDWFAEKELFLGMSIYIVGWPIGIALGQAIQPSLAEQAPWTTVFYLSAIVLTMGLVAVALLYRPPPGSVRAEQARVSEMSARELWLVSITSAMWMTINGAYMVIVSFGPALISEQGFSFSDSAFIVSILSWVFFLGLPLGGYLASRFSAPNVVVVSGLVVTVIVGAAIPFTSIPIVTFAVFGLFYALAAPVVGSLPAEALHPENRGPGLGIFQVGNFVGSAVFPIVAGVLMDWTGSATTCMVLATGLVFTTLCLLGLFRFEQRRLPLR